MMKKFSLCAILLLCIAAFNGCSKSGSSSTAANMMYTVNGIGDINVRQYIDTSVTVPIAVGYASGTQEPVTLTISNLPAGVTAAQTSQSGTPSFAATFTLNINCTTAGSYPVTITATAANTTSKTYTFNIVVAANTPFTYNITGIPSSNISIPQYTDTTLSIPLTATIVSGTAVPVTITTDSLPGNITLSGSSLMGTPTFSGTIALKVVTNTAGTYRVALHATSSYGTQYYSFNIVVTSGNCASAIAGTYSTITTTCTPALPPYPTYAVITTTSTSNQVRLDAGAGGVPLICDLNCSAGTLIMETNSNVDLTCNGGSGTFSAGQVVATYTLTPNGGGSPYTCASTFSK